MTWHSTEALKPGEDSMTNAMDPRSARNYFSAIFLSREPERDPIEAGYAEPTVHGYPTNE